MIIIPESVEDIVTIITSEFRSFGGGNVNTDNPISIALQNQPACFAAGVDICDVVNRVVELYIEAREHMPSKFSLYDILGDLEDRDE